MSRIRLTSKTRIANDPSDMEGNRQDCGKKTRMNKYTNFDPAKDDVGGRGNKNTDGSKLHEQDVRERDEMNIGKLRQAKAWQASKLATKLAIYLLGEKAPSSMVKAQAAEFLALGNARLAKAVNRFAKTQYLYAEQDQQENKSAKTEEEQGEGEEQGKGEEKQGCGDVQAQEQEKAPQQLVQQAKDDDNDEIDDACLASLFEQNSNNLVASKNQNRSSKKVGVQKLSQPTVKVASNKAVDLSSIWEGAPDVSKIFN